MNNSDYRNKSINKQLTTRVEKDSKERPILSVKNLSTSFYTKAGEVEALRGVNFDIHSGEILGIVGESGSGKSITAKSILRLIESPGKIKAGDLVFKGESLLDLSEKELRKLRGNRIAMIFQDPMSSLNPVFKIGKQMIEILQRHQSLTSNLAKLRAISLLRQVGINEAETIINSYPHQLSGGMRQRVMIAMALSCDPDLLIADEPTTALDVTIQAQILALMRQLRIQIGSSILFITHDLGVVSSLCDRIMVMYGGLVMEIGSAQEIFTEAKHPYTKGLLRSIPKLDLSSDVHEYTNNNGSKRLFSIEGSPPSLISPPLGCPFMARCQRATKLCSELPKRIDLSPTHQIYCWYID